MNAQTSNILPVILLNCPLIYRNWYSMSIKSQSSLLDEKIDLKKS